MSDNSGVDKRRGRGAGGIAFDSSIVVSLGLILCTSSRKPSRDWTMTAGFFDLNLQEANSMTTTDPVPKEDSVDCGFCLYGTVAGDDRR